MTQPIDQLEKELDSLKAQAKQELESANQLEELERVRIKFLGRKGVLTSYLALLKDPTRPQEEKSRLGARINRLKEELELALKERRRGMTLREEAAVSSDLTLPGVHLPVGRLHPITQTVQEIVQVFRRMGFKVVDGPEVETEYYNFEALNIPPEHPSRESFDTFYLKNHFLLRSHTSPVQIRFMEKHQPPFQIVVPGKVFRPDAVDASHSFQFHQVEGLAVARDITFSDLKGILALWAKELFGPKAVLRFRPHYFPFTEPSAEVDLTCIFCQGEGCRVCGRRGWLEILGCGMVHPAVFKAVGYLPEWQGLAFGLGVERVAMLKHAIEDIRLFFENDLRFLTQFP